MDQYGSLLQDFQKVNTDQQINRVIILPSGKILIHGAFKWLNGQRVGRIALLNSDGSVDPTFATDMHAMTTNVMVQSTGKIITVTTLAGNPYPELQRWNSNGTRDYSFASNHTGNISDAILGEDDKIYIADNRFIRRIMPDGPLDNAYVFAEDPSRTINKLALQVDGKVIASVTQIVSLSPFTFNYTLQRFDTDGLIDPTFNAAGASQAISDFMIRKNGKIDITGYFISFGSETGNAIELNSNGSTNRVLVTTDSNGMGFLYEDSQENIFVTGSFEAINNLKVKKIGKLKPGYQVDLSFKLPVFRTPGSTFYLPLGIQSTGKMLIGGSYSFGGVENDSSKIGRLLLNGKHDPSFKASIRNPGSNFNQPTLNAITVQKDDKIIVGGINVFEPLSPALRRLLPDGQLDNSFQIGSGPALSNNFPASVQFIKIFNSKIFILGNFDRFNGDVCQSLIILDKDGKKIGPEKNTLPAGAYFQDIEFQSDGKILLLGAFPLSGNDNRRFLRLNLDGSIDESFQLHDVNGNPNDIGVDANDNILLVGNYLDFDVDKILKRYKPNGEEDPTLDLGVGFSSNDILTGYFVRPLENNLIAVGGYFTGYKNSTYPGLVLLTNDGSIVPFSNPFDSLSYPIVSTYANKTLYLAGRFSKKGTDLRGAVKMLFPIDHNVTDFEVEASSPLAIDLSWNGEFRGQEKIVIESSSPDNSNYHKVADLMPGVNSYTIEGLSEVTPYYFRITGMNEYYSSGWIEGKDTTEIAPQIPLPATEITPESFVARWTYEPGTDSCLLQVSHDNFTSFLSGYENLIVKSGERSVVGLEEGETYRYRVKRFKNNKSSEFSAPVIVNIITEIEKSPLKVSVYPNPVSDYLSIDLPENITNADVVVHSASGALVGKYSFTGKASNIDLRNLPQGIFILTISSSGVSKKYKLVRSE